MLSLRLTAVLIICAIRSSVITADVTYGELEELDATCPTLDNCKVRRNFDSLEKYTCNCASFCAELGTCCVDARLRGRRPPNRKPTCRSVNVESGYTYFMVDYCIHSPSTDETFEKLCNEEWDEDDNLMSLVPVTSLSSNVTYKNYFCLRCNEATEQFRYWNVRMKSSEAKTADAPGRGVELTYSKASKTWMAAVGETGDPVPVTLFMEIPGEIQVLPKVCALNAISSCAAQWKIKEVKRKCAQYTSYIHIPKNGVNVMFRNPHCALCNFEDLVRFGCGVVFDGRRVTAKRPFSFTHLLDINRSDGDKVGLIQRCDDNSTWDPFFNKCRTLKCALPGYTLKNGGCVAP